MNARPHDDDRERGPVDGRPFLSIPYWSGPGTADDGTARPLASNVLHWLCPSIQPGPYVPGEPLDVTVEVANHGPANAAIVAVVSLYWADPTVGFASPAFLGAAAVPVAPRGGRARTAVITGLIPASAPAHVCLLARVSHPLDPAGAQADPIGDRHWAQRNLQSVAVAAGAQAVLPFAVGNPLAHEANFELRLEALHSERLEELAHALDLRPAENRETLLVGWPPGSEELVAPERHAERLLLDRGEQRQMQLVVAAQDGLRPEEIVAVELTLLADGELAVGSLGIVVRGDGDR